MLELGISEEDSKDVFQDSVTVLYENTQREGFVLTSKASTYIYGVCQNKAKEFQRKQNNNVFSRGKISEDPIPQNFDEEEPKLPTEEEIKEAIDGLSSPCSEILAAFYYHQASIKEISEKHGYKNENTARQAKYKCMQRLKETLLSKYHD